MFFYDLYYLKSCIFMIHAIFQASISDLCHLSLFLFETLLARIDRRRRRNRYPYHDVLHLLLFMLFEALWFYDLCHFKPRLSMINAVLCLHASLVAPKPQSLRPAP